MVGAEDLIVDFGAGNPFPQVVGNKEVIDPPPDIFRTGLEPVRLIRFPFSYVF